MDHRIYGYLMAESYTHKCNVVYECVDKNPKSIPGSVANTSGAMFLHVQAKGNGLPCPPYDNVKELACVVCTKWTKYYLNCLTSIFLSDLVIYATMFETEVESVC